MRSTWLSLPPELYLKTRPPQFIDQPLATLLFDNWVASCCEVWGNAAIQPGYRVWVALYWWIDMVVYWCLGLVVYWVGMCDAISCQALLLSHGSLPLIRLSDTCTNAHHATMPQYKTLSSKARRCCTTFALIRLYDTRASVQRNKSIPAQVTRCTCATTAPPLCQHTANQEIWHLFQCPQCHRTLECKISIISFWGELIIQNLGYGLVIKEQLFFIIFCATVTLNCDWHTVYPAVACLATQQSSRAYPIHDTPSHQFHFNPDDPVSIQWFKWNLVGYTRSSLPRYLKDDWDQFESQYLCVCECKEYMMRIVSDASNDDDD